MTREKRQVPIEGEENSYGWSKWESRIERSNRDREDKDTEENTESEI